MKNYSVAIVNSSVHWNFMFDLPILIPQSFFPHTICTLLVVDVNTSYGTYNKDQIKDNELFKTILTQLMV